MAVIEKTINLNVDSKAAQSDIDKLTKEVKGLDKTFSKTSKGAGDSLKGIEKGADAAKKGTDGASKGFKGLGTAMKAAGIGFVIAALQGLKEVFSQNQKVVDAFSTAFETFSIVANQVVGAVINVYESVTQSSDSFDALGKVMDNIITLVLNPFKAQFYAIKLSLQVAQLAWEKSFFGSGDTSTIKKLNKEIRQTKADLEGVAVSQIEAFKSIAKNTGEAISEVANVAKVVVEEVSKVSISAAAEQAALNVQLKNSAELAVAQQARLVEKYDLQAESLRQVRDEERLSITERKAANDNLLEVLDKQESAMLKQADLQIAAAQNEVNKNNTIEAQVALIDALGNREGVLAQVQGLRSEQKANDLALDRESIELTNSKSEAESNLSIERQRFNAEQIDDELLKLEALKQIDLLYGEKEAERLQAVVDNANLETQAKVDAQIALDEFMEQSRQTNITNDTAIAEQEAALEAESVKKKAEADAAQVEIDNKTRKAKEENLAKVGNALSSFSELAGKETAAGKALAIASTLIQTYQSAQSSYASLAPIPVVGPALGVAAAGAAVFAGMKQIQNIKKTKVPGGGGGASAGGGASVGAAPTPPSFNVVGASETSALGDAVASQTNEPVQAYVVSNDVTTAQSLENNIVEGATI